MSASGDRLRLLILALVVFVSMLGVGIIAPFLPLYARSLGASGMMMGLVFSSFSLARALVMPYVGVMSDRHGRKVFLVVGLIGYAASALLLLLSSTPWELVGNRVLQGVFAAMVLPVAMALVAELAPDGREGRIFGWYNTALLMGFGVGPLMGGFLFDHLGMDSNFVAMAGLSLLALLMVMIWIKEAPVEGGADPGATVWRQLGLIRHRGLLAVCLCRVGTTMGMGCFVTFLPSLAIERAVPVSEVGVLLAVNLFVMTIMQSGAGWMADRFPRHWLAAAGALASGGIKVMLPYSADLTEMMTLVVLEGVASGLAFPALTALAVAHGRRAGAGMGVTMSLFTLALSAGIFIGPVSGGALADIWGMGAPFVLAGVASAAGALVLLILNPPGTGRAGDLPTPSAPV